MVRVLRSPADLLGCALLPDLCALCGCPLPHLSTVPICAVCWAGIPVLSGPACLRCGDTLESPAYRGESAGLCRVCRLAPPPFRRAVAYGPYDGRMKAAIHALKYGRLQPASRPLGRMLALAIARLADEAPSAMLVIPVPLHRSRIARRGFNQSRALARAALRSLAASHPHWRLTLASGTLLRQRPTESQAGLSPRQRRLNLRGAFTVSDPAAVEGRHILLIDDILTTGATARAASSALLRAGAASVWVATLARAQRAFAAGESFIDGNRDSERSGNPLDRQAQTRSMHSSMHQPSF